MRPISTSMKSLREWAEKKDPGEVVGEQGIHDSCPVACYLQEKGAEDPSVLGGSVEYFRRDQEGDQHRIYRRHTPKLRSIVLKVDSLDTEEKDGSPVIAVTAEQFLTILNDVEQGATA